MSRSLSVFFPSLLVSYCIVVFEVIILSTLSLSRFPKFCAFYVDVQTLFQTLYLDSSHSAGSLVSVPIAQGNWLSQACPTVSLLSHPQPQWESLRLQFLLDTLFSTFSLSRLAKFHLL